MGWDAAKAWASQLTITDATYGTVSGWRLASARLQTPVNYEYSVDGSTDYGYNITRSELGHMFFNNLGNKAYRDVNGNGPQINWGLKNTIYKGVNGNIAIQNLQNSYYWNDEMSARDTSIAWTFVMAYGRQIGYYKKQSFFVWAVRDGDVCTTSPCPVIPVNEVPLPAAAWLFGAALMGLAGVRRRK